MERITVMEPRIRPSVTEFQLTGNQRIEYVDHYGSTDARWTAAAAWVSTDRSSEEEYDKCLPVVRRCGSHDHVSIFYHSLITFDLDIAIPTARQLLKHRVGVTRTEEIFDDLNLQANERSGRYVVFSESDIFIPEILRQGSAKIKQGSLDKAVTEHDRALAVYHDAMIQGVAAYNALLEIGVAREQARFVLPQGMITHIRTTWSLPALAHFIKLRKAHDAQREIQEFASVFEEYMVCLFPDSYAAYLLEEEVKAQKEEKDAEPHTGI